MLCSNVHLKTHNCQIYAVRQNGLKLHHFPCCATEIVRMRLTNLFMQCAKYYNRRPYLFIYLAVGICTSIFDSYDTK